MKPHEVISRKPIRRTKKSFGGCFSCKRRKIKCDETKSRCKNCSKADLECAWPAARVRPTKNVKVADPESKPKATGVANQNLKTPLPSDVGKASNTLDQTIGGRENEWGIAWPKYFESQGHTSPGSNKQMPGQFHRDELFQPGRNVRPKVDAFPISSVRQRNYLFIRELDSADDEVQFMMQDNRAEAMSRLLPVQSPSLPTQSCHLHGPLATDAKNDAESPEHFAEGPEVQGVAVSYGSRNPQDEQDLIELPREDNKYGVIDYSLSRIASPDSYIDSMFYANFVNRFLPTIAQPHFHHTLPQHSLVLSAASQSTMLTEIFIVCGASLVSFDNLLYREVAQEKYKVALLHFLRKMKQGVVHSSEDWFFVAVQVLQTLCLRDGFGGGNVTKCAAHFSPACKIIVQKVLSRAHDNTSTKPQFSPLEKVLIENFIFNYSITIFFCDHTKLEALMPNPFDFFSLTNPKLTQMSYEDGSPQSSRMSVLAFQIAAKCSWLCRLRLPLNAADQRLHYELLQLADTILFSLNSVDFSGQEIRVQNTVSIAKVVLRSSIILLRKMLDMQGVRAHHLQQLVKEIAGDVAQPHNKDIIFPIWSLMIVASTSLDSSHKVFYKERLQKLIDISRSKIAIQVLNHLEGLWEIYSGDEPFELLFDTEVLDQVCN